MDTDIMDTTDTMTTATITDTTVLLLFTLPIPAQLMVAQ
jgi:hypothetical protein